MRLIGVDIYIWSEKLPNLPKQVGHLSLNMISNSGTRLFPPPTPEIEITDWFQCRYLAQSEITDKDIQDFIKVLSPNFTWTMIQKLFEMNGVTAFSQPY